MGDKTKISWTGSTINPIRARRKVRKAGKVVVKTGWHCERVSDGCRNCYSEGLNRPYGTGLDFKPGHRDDVEIFLDEKMLHKPLGWAKGRPIFWNAMTDLFADFVPDDVIDQHFAVMAMTPHHMHQILTKRPERARRYLEGIEEGGQFYAGFRDAMVEGMAQSIYASRTGEDPSLWLAVHFPLPNVWIGFSAEDQGNFDARWPHIEPLARAGWLTWVSLEPLLGPVDMRFFGPASHELRWVVSGDESGRARRPCDPNWHRSIRNQCVVAGVPYFLKQMFIDGVKVENPALDGRQWMQFPVMAA